MVLVVLAGLVTLAGCGNTDWGKCPCIGLFQPNRPSVFIDLSDPVDGVYDMYNTPDGMTLDKRTGIMYLAVPNFNENCFKPGVMIKIMPDNSWSVLCKMPVSPDTQRAAPMGCGMGPDGNIYVADNQFFYNINRKSRLYRVVLDEKGDVVGKKGPDGKPLLDAKGKPVPRVEIAADGFTLSNAVYWRGDNCYISDTFVVDNGEMNVGASYIYKITLEEMKAGTVTVTDDHIVARLKTIERGRGDTAGADGITFDGEGNMYCGNFGDGRIFKFTMNADGTVKGEPECIIDDEKFMPSADGMFWDETSNMIYIAESASNAIRRFSLDGKIRETVWENDDVDGSNGLLDQPCEVIIRGDDLISVDFDMSFPGLKNTKYDKWHGLHIIKLDRDRGEK